MLVLFKWRCYMSFEYYCSSSPWNSYLSQYPRCKGIWSKTIFVTWSLEPLSVSQHTGVLTQFICENVVLISANTLLLGYFAQYTSDIILLGIVTCLFFFWKCCSSWYCSIILLFAVIPFRLFVWPYGLAILRSAFILFLCSQWFVWCCRLVGIWEINKVELHCTLQKTVRPQRWSPDLLICDLAEHKYDSGKNRVTVFEFEVI